MKKITWFVILFLKACFPLLSQIASEQDSLLITEECDVMHPLLYEHPTQNNIPFSTKTLTSELTSGQINSLSILKAQISGLTFSGSSGAPGASVYGRIRGSNSVLNDNAPFIILDGVPVNNDTWGYGIGGVDLSNRLIDINPNDIQTINIYKGPASTVKYGVRGGNGVIELMTKTGMGQSYRASVTSTVWGNQVNKLPARQFQYAQGRPVSGVPIWRGPETGEGFSWGPEIAELEFDGSSNYDYDLNGRLVSGGTGNGQPAKAYNPYDFFVNGLAYQLNATVGGTKRAGDYFFSVSRTLSNGYAPLASFGKNNVFGRVRYVFRSKIRADLSVHVSDSNGYRLQRGSNLQGIMIGLLRTAPTFDNGNGKTGKQAVNSLSAYQLEDGSQRSYRAGIYDNPYWSVNKNPFEDETVRFISNLSLIWDQPIKIHTFHWLEGKVAFDYYADKRHNAHDFNPGIYAGRVDITDLIYKGLYTSITANFRKGFASGWYYKTQLGVDYFQHFFKDTTTSGLNLITPGIFTLANTQMLESSRATIQKKIAGTFASVDLKYQKWFEFNISGRNDWSSALSFNTGIALSYGTTATFILFQKTEEEEVKPNQQLKVHLSYGKALNDAPAHLTQNYFATSVIGGDPYIPAISIPGVEVADFLGNDHLKPEATRSFEIGMRGKFRDRIELDLTWYDAYTRDVILLSGLPASSGFQSTAENGGEISNKGIELDLLAQVLQREKFTWEVAVNFNRARNMVEKIPESAGEIQLSGFATTSSRVLEGYPYGVIWGDAFTRNDSGQLIIDNEGWPLVDQQQKVLGDPNPDWIMGLFNRVKIGKMFSLSALLDIKKGGDMWCGTCGLMDYFGVSQQSAEERNETMIFEGVREDGSPNNIAVALADPATGVFGYYRTRYGFGFSEMNIEDASWIRLRTISLQYEQTYNHFHKFPFRKMSISLFAHNLWLRTKYPGIDPETNLTGPSNGFGLDYFNMPGVKSFGVSIKLFY